MSGTKKISNNSGVAINVSVTGRIGAEPGHEGKTVFGVIQPHGSITLEYGNDQNPYMDALVASETSNGSAINQNFKCTARGGPGTLDNLFNANSELVLAYNAATYDFALSSHN
jgi:hypothetical protein